MQRSEREQCVLVIYLFTKNIYFYSKNVNTVCINTSKEKSAFIKYYLILFVSFTDIYLIDKFSVKYMTMSDK